MVDFGTGDGAFVVRTAAADPITLVVGVDANLAGLGAGYRRAERRRLHNAVFVLATAEDPPEALTGTADELQVQFPWGSLLRAIVDPDRRIAAGLSRLLTPTGTMRISLSITARDGLDAIGELDASKASAVAERFAAASGLIATGVDPVTIAETTWAKRLGIGGSRAGYHLRFAGPANAGQ